MNPEHEQFVAQANEPGRLNVLSVFLSVDGEANACHPGTWSVFVRLTGCRVGCHWCDTKYSWSIKQGKQVTPLDLANMVDATARGARKVTLTGGEPLEQGGGELRVFVDTLVSRGYIVTVETAGTHDWRPLKVLAPSHIYIIADVKMPSAKAVKPTFWGAFSSMHSADVVKYVIADRNDFQVATKTAARLHALGCKARMVFSPALGLMNPKDLFVLMKDTSEVIELQIGYNLQMHKYIFAGDDAAAWRQEEGSGEDYSRVGVPEEER